MQLVIVRLLQRMLNHIGMHTLDFCAWNLISVILVKVLAPELLLVYVSS